MVEGGGDDVRDVRDGDDDGIVVVSSEVMASRCGRGKGVSLLSAGSRVGSS